MIEVSNLDYAKKWRNAAQQAEGWPAGLRAWSRDMLLNVCSVVDQESNSPSLRSLFCHYVFDDQCEAFERILVSLKTIGQFVDTDTCMDMLHGRRAIDGRYFHLSIDDGFRNVFVNAMPILRRHGIPAIFFVPTSLVGANWNTAKDYCLKTTGYSGVIELAQWADLREMAVAGIEIGSHTKTHARFSDISSDPARLHEELVESKLILEDQLGQECKYISWPYGKTRDADQPSVDKVIEAGYRGCFGGFRGTVRPAQTDPFRIPRHHFEAQWRLGHILYFARGGNESAASGAEHNR